MKHFTKQHRKCVYLCPRNLGEHSTITTERHTVSSSLRTVQLNETCNSSSILLLCFIITVKFGRIIIPHFTGASHSRRSLGQLHQLKWNVMHIKLHNHLQLYSLSISLKKKSDLYNTKHRPTAEYLHFNKSTWSLENTLEVTMRGHWEKTRNEGGKRMKGSFYENDYSLTKVG
jgi:hypothetical protein